MIEKLLHISVINGSIALVLCVWILAVYGYGMWFLKLVRKRYLIFGSLLGDSLALASLLAFIAGGFALMFFVSVWHLFFPLWGWVSVVVALLGLILFGFELRAFVAGFGYKQVAFSAALALLVLLPLSTLSDSVGDSVNYHIQIVSWIQESPLVFGLGNVHTRLGYNGLIYGFYALTDVSQIIPHLRSFVGNEVMYFSLLFSAFWAFMRLLQNRTTRFYELFIICALMPFPFILKWGEFMGLYVEGVGAVFGVAIFATLLYIMDLASGSQGRVGFGAKNGDFCGESAVTHAQVRAFDSPCKAPFLLPKSHREQVESKAQSHDSSPNDLAMLSKPFELAQSLEVAEHLDHIFAANFVQLLTSLADVVLFSAAIPYQGGVCHINEQPPAYWAELFAKQGYVCLDFLRPSIWSDESVLWWYRQNLLVFVHKDRQAQLFPTLSPVSVPAYLPHPIIWEEKNKWLESVLNAHLHKPLSTGLKLIAKWILIKLHLLESLKRIVKPRH